MLNGNSLIRIENNKLTLSTYSGNVSLADLSTENVIEVVESHKLHFQVPYSSTVLTLSYLSISILLYTSIPLHFGSK